MNKKILVVACLMVMTTVFSGCDLLGGDKDKKVTEDSKTESNVEQNGESGTSGDGDYFETMKDLMARGKSMKCTYTQKIDSGNTADGTIYMSGGNARTEIIANKGTAQEAEMYAIINKDWVYSWTNASSKGYKMTTEASELSEKNEETVSDLSKDIKFKCKSWKKDSSKFKVPTNIKFDDLSEMMEGFGDVDLGETIKEAEAESKKFLCEFCQSAPDPAECLGDVVCDWSK